MLLPIARSAYAHDVELWVAGGDQTAFTSALAMHETDSWAGRHTGDVDESMATFDQHEWWIARLLARQGHNVIALPTRHLAGLRSPDAAVGGLLTEFKTYTGRNPRQLLCRVGKALPQADRVVVGVDAPWDSVMLRSVFRAATASAHRRGIRAVMFIGDDFQLEWGDWNGCLATRHPRPTADASPAELIVPAVNDLRREPVARTHACCAPEMSRLDSNDYSAGSDAEIHSRRPGGMMTHTTTACNLPLLSK